MSSPIDYRPDNFFRIIHPTEGLSPATIILERRVGSSLRRSQIYGRELESLSRQAYGIPDLFFSTASFSAKPLTVNFKRVSCLHLQIPQTTQDATVILPLRLSQLGIPHPTEITWDGNLFTFLWVLDSPIEAHEMHIYALLQRFLYDAAKDFQPVPATLSTTFLTRLIGSKNSLTGGYICIAGGNDKTHNRQHFEKCLFQNKNISICDYKKLERHAGTLRELLVLFSERLFDIPKSPELFDKWIIFFGAALSEFCAISTLKIELSAIAESLENQCWSRISEQYTPLINSICNTVKDGYINYADKEFSIDHPGWLELLRRDLNILDSEIKNFDLLTISGAQGPSPHLAARPPIITTIGALDFVPVNTLFMHRAA